MRQKTKAFLFFWTCAAALAVSMVEWPTAGRYFAAVLSGMALRRLSLDLFDHDREGGQ